MGGPGCVHSLPCELESERGSPTGLCLASGAAAGPFVEGVSPKGPVGPGGREPVTSSWRLVAHHTRLGAYTHAQFSLYMRQGRGERGRAARQGLATRARGACAAGGAIVDEASCPGGTEQMPAIAMCGSRHCLPSFCTRVSFFSRFWAPSQIPTRHKAPNSQQNARPHPGTRRFTMAMHGRVRSVRCSSYWSHVGAHVGGRPFWAASRVAAHVLLAIRLASSAFLCDELTAHRSACSLPASCWHGRRRR